MMKRSFPWLWTLKDAKFTKDRGTVFSCFAGGGGSSMGYKLAGFDVIGCNEIDPRMAKVYDANHNPRYLYCEPIQRFKTRTDLPEELYSLDILDGSPPCSSFSSLGTREKGWGKKKKFREGQSEQVLDTLFFDFIDLAKKLQPKVVIAENVKGLVQAKAREYYWRIIHEFHEAGYLVTDRLLNAAFMGVPQRRERIFFCAIRKDLANNLPLAHILFSSVPHLRLLYDYDPIPFRHCWDGPDGDGRPVKGKILELLKECRPNERFLDRAAERLTGKMNFFSVGVLTPDRICPTINATNNHVVLSTKKGLSRDELCKVSSFPIDFDFQGQNPNYVCGMSVPPVMMARVANDVAEQWLGR